jgi:hypothetical protein
MWRKFVHFVLMLSLCVQGLSFAGHAAASDEALIHAVMHWQESGHHHHDDGSLHEEESDESRAHAMVESCPFIIVMPQADNATDFHPPAPRIENDAVAPPPFLEGIRRPPRLGH